MTVYEKLLIYSLGIISKKRYTKKQIKDKLVARLKKIEASYTKEKYSKKNICNGSEGNNNSLAIDNDVICKVLDRLIELRYIEDKRFSEDYISQHILLRPRGLKLIRGELLKKGVSANIIDSAIDSIEINEEDMVQRVFDKRFKKFKREDVDYYKFKSKVFSYLFSKGFNKDYIYKVFDSWYNNSV